ncbi:MAG TPA: GerMN domain-containing protein [Acidimicrobiales bacterium]|nr:GerMN domain-containing protein [Acidimicrobiales bacterium]
MSASRSRALAAAGLVAAGALLAGCGIPLSNAAQPLPLSRVPPALLRGPVSTTTTAPSNSTHAVPIGIYFLDNSGANARLVRTIAHVQPPATAVEALDFLTNGPTAADSRYHGLQTALSQSPQATPGVVRVNRQTGIATVALDDTTYTLFGTQAYEAFAQIVFTVTDPQFGIKSVDFTFGGSSAQAYLPDGTFISRPVTRADYASLAPVTPTTKRAVTHVTHVTHASGARPLT